MTRARWCGKVILLIDSCRSASALISGAMPNDEPMRKHAPDRPPSLACRRVSASCSEDRSLPSGVSTQKKAALGQLRADELRLLLQALGDLRGARILRQAAFRQLDELEGAVGLQPLGVFGGRLGIEFLLELAHADERDGKHKNLRVFKKPAHTDRFFA